MGQKCVVYNSDSRLSCGTCIPASVVLCVPTHKVAPHLCPDGVTSQPFEWSHIEGTIGDAKKLGGNCGATCWRYTICFDEEQIADGYELETADITGVFCKGCLATYIEDLVGNEPFFTDNEDGTVTFTSPHGCEFTFNAEVPVTLQAPYRNINLKNVGQVVKATPGRLSGWYIFNQHVSNIRYLKFYNKATQPTSVDTPFLTVPIPANGSGSNIDWSKLPPFSLGIGVRATVNIADNDNTAPGDNEVVVNIFFE